MTSTITASKYDRKWDSDNGTVYYHKVTMENGDEFSIGSKEQDPDWLNVGKTLDYEITKEDPKYGKSAKRVTQGKAGDYKGKGGGWQKEPFEERAVGFAFSYAKDLTVAGKLEPGKKMIETANTILDAMIASRNRVAK